MNSAEFETARIAKIAAEIVEEMEKRSEPIDILIAALNSAASTMSNAVARMTLLAIIHQTTKR